MWLWRGSSETLGRMENMFRLVCGTTFCLALRATVREIVDELIENCLKYKTTTTRRGFNYHEAAFLWISADACLFCLY